MPNQAARPIAAPRPSISLSLRAAALSSLLVASAGCAAPLQNGGVDVAAGAGDRLGLLCRWRRGDDARKDLCAAPEAAEPARARKLASDRDKLRGPLAEGREGDSLIENAEVAFVIRQVTPGASIADGGGALIDAADARARVDEIGRVTARLGERFAPLYEELTSGVDESGAAWVEVSGHEASTPTLKITTRYSLGPLDRAVLITTTLESQSASAVGLLDLGDAIDWGAMSVISPGKEAGATGEVKGPYAAAVGSDVGYLLAPVEDAEVSSRTDGKTSSVSIERDVTLPPGASARYQRVFAVAPRPDPVAVATELFYMQGGAPGGVAVKLIDAGGAAVPPPPGSRLLIDRSSASGEPSQRAPLWWMRAESAPEDPSIIGGELPPGRYTLRFEGGGRHERKEASVVVTSGAVSKLTLVIEGADGL